MGWSVSRSVEHAQRPGFDLWPNLMVHRVSNSTSEVEKRGLEFTVILDFIENSGQALLHETLSRK